jgi:gamma-glutamylcyclotransferase (GGCT)/AIG2-like uncharacterized protein YtfP
MFVFVYGTLKKGYGNHRLLENSKFIGNAKVRFEKISSCGFPRSSLEIKKAEKEYVVKSIRLMMRHWKILMH